MIIKLQKQYNRVISSDPDIIGEDPLSETVPPANHEKSRLTQSQAVGIGTGLIGGGGLGFLIRNIRKKKYGIDKLNQDYTKLIDAYKKYYGIDGDRVRETALKNYNKTYNNYKQFLDRRILSKKNIPIAIGSVTGPALGLLLTSNRNKKNES